MNIGERILLSLSRAPTSKDYGSDNSKCSIDNSLSSLENGYSNFGALVSGKAVADFGCGIGHQSIALVRKYNCSVVGIDSNQKTLEKAIEQSKLYDIPRSQLSFVDKISDSMFNKFDIVISRNSFEHFGNPSMILGEMQRLINESGILLIAFGPPWLAPNGSHMHFFCKVPWINVIFPEETVMKVRSHFRSDGASKYEDVESGLNRMTIAKFERIIMSSDLNIEYMNYRAMRGARLLSKIPFLREFFIEYVNVILSKATQQSAPQRCKTEGVRQKGRCSALSVPK